MSEVTHGEFAQVYMCSGMEKKIEARANHLRVYLELQKPLLAKPFFLLDHLKVSPGHGRPRGFVVFCTFCREGRGSLWSQAHLILMKHRTRFAT